MSITSHAQVNNFIDSGAVWSIDDYKLFIINQDSTIGTKDYKKVFAIKDSIIDFPNSYLYSLVRYDSITQKVYTLLPNSSSEKLLYDFDILVGDTISVNQFDPIFFEENSICTQELLVRVESIDSIYFQGRYLNKYIISGVNWYYYPEYWIEGIGSSFGLFGSGLIDCDAADVITPRLLCFNYGDSTLSLNSEETCYKEYNPQTSILETKSDDLKIYPNPVSSNTFIINSKISIEAVKIKTIEGKDVDFVFLKSEKKVDVSKVPKGFYIIELTLKGKRATEQFKILKN